MVCGINMCCKKYLTGEQVHMKESGVKELLVCHPINMALYFLISNFCKLLIIIKQDSSL